LVNIAVADVGAINDGDAAVTDDLHQMIVIDLGGGVFVQPQSNQIRVERDGGDQATEAVARAKVLVDDDSVGQPSPGPNCTIP
jgi:hypothetical protein